MIQKILLSRALVREGVPSWVSTRQIYWTLMDNLTYAAKIFSDRNLDRKKLG